MKELEARIESLIDKRPKEKARKTYKLYYNGNPLRLQSGKTVWSQINHAKNAIWNEFQRDISRYQWAGHSWEHYSAADFKERECREEEIKQKIMELIEIREISA